ncbi:MAG: DMT family transporter [Candidatus Helarchaeota archaeon]
MSDYFFGPLEDYVLGIIMAILAAATFTLGAVFQKKGTEDLMLKNIEIKLSNVSSLIAMLKSKIWVLGIILGIVGGLPYVASQALIGVALTQPLQGTGLLFLVLVAYYYLKESLKKEEIIGIIILIIGPIFLSISNVGDVSQSFDITDPSAINAMLIFYGLCLSGIIITYVLAAKDIKPSEMLAMNSGIFFGMGAVSSQIGVYFLELNEGLISILGAILGFSMIFIGNGIGTIIVNIAFQKGKAIRVIPIQSTGNLLIPIFGGVLIFLQSVQYWSFFIIGVTCQLLGGLFIVRLQAQIQESQELQSETDEQN